jgi:hypothetical protein
LSSASEKNTVLSAEKVQELKKDYLRKLRPFEAGKPLGVEEFRKYFFELREKEVR